MNLIFVTIPKNKTYYKRNENKNNSHWKNP